MSLLGLTGESRRPGPCGTRVHFPAVVDEAEGKETVIIPSISRTKPLDCLKSDAEPLLVLFSLLTPSPQSLHRNSESYRDGLVTSGPPAPHKWMEGGGAVKLGSGSAGLRLVVGSGQPVCGEEPREALPPGRCGRSLLIGLSSGFTLTQHGNTS